jgi:hypothetical protein
VCGELLILGKSVIRHTQDQNANEFILSNNHVLADVNLAKPGQLIVQPGLVDTPEACTPTPSDVVATFSRTVKIKFGGKNTIDAAIAAVNAGDVSPEILNIGKIASSVATPTIGLAVQKMGRTTCLTTGTISAVGVNAKISYDAGGGTKTAKFINQIVIEDLASAHLTSPVFTPTRISIGARPSAWSFEP